MNTLLKRISNDPNEVVAAGEAFQQFLTAQKRMQDELNEAWEFVEQSMRDAGITKIKGEWGQVSFVPRKSWHVTGTIPPRFYKMTLDTTKLNYMAKNGEKLPLGVISTTSYNFRKDLKI